MKMMMKMKMMKHMMDAGWNMMKINMGGIKIKIITPPGSGVQTHEAKMTCHKTTTCDKPCDKPTEKTCDKPTDKTCDKPKNG